MRLSSLCRSLITIYYQGRDCKSLLNRVSFFFRFKESNYKSSLELIMVSTVLTVVLLFHLLFVCIANEFAAEYLLKGLFCFIILLLIFSPFFYFLFFFKNKIYSGVVFSKVGALNLSHWNENHIYIYICMYVYTRFFQTLEICFLGLSE